MSKRRAAKRARREAKRSARPRLLNEGSRVARDLLHTVIESHGVDLTQLSLVIVHKNAKAEYAKSFPELVDLGVGWSFDLVPVPDVIPLGPNRNVTPPGDAAVLLILTEEGALVQLVPFTEFLPLSDVGDIKKAGKRYLLTLAQSAWLFFLSREKDLRPNIRRLHRDFHDLVRATVVSELARPGRKRSLFEIVFALAGGDQLEAAATNEPEPDSLPTLLSVATPIRVNRDRSSTRKFA